MSREQFQSLCDAFTEMFGTPAHVMTPSDSGALAFYVGLGPHRASFYYVPEVSHCDAFMILDAGPLPEAVDAKALAMLLQINALTYGSRSPVIGLSEDGHLLVHLDFGLGSVSAQALLSAATGLSDWSKDWLAGRWKNGDAELPPPLNYTTA